MVEFNYGAIDGIHIILEQWNKMDYREKNLSERTGDKYFIPKGLIATCLTLISLPIAIIYFDTVRELGSVSATNRSILNGLERFGQGLTERPLLPR